MNEAVVLRAEKIFLIDCRINSLETRTAFQEKFGKFGFKVFIPRRCTSKLQPMDHEEHFGAFKSHVRKVQDELMVSGSIEFRLLAWNMPKVREVVVSALASGKSCSRIRLN